MAQEKREGAISFRFNFAHCDTGSTHAAETFCTHTKWRIWGGIEAIIEHRRELDSACLLDQKPTQKYKMHACLVLALCFHPMCSIFPFPYRAHLISMHPLKLIDVSHLNGSSVGRPGIQVQTDASRKAKSWPVIQQVHTEGVFADERVSRLRVLASSQPGMIRQSPRIGCLSSLNVETLC